MRRTQVLFAVALGVFFFTTQTQAQTPQLTVEQTLTYINNKLAEYPPEPGGDASSRTYRIELNPDRSKIRVIMTIDWINCASCPCPGQRGRTNYTFEAYILQIKPPTHIISTVVHGSYIISLDCERDDECWLRGKTTKYSEYLSPSCPQEHYERYPENPEIDKYIWISFRTNSEAAERLRRAFEHLLRMVRVENKQRDEQQRKKNDPNDPFAKPPQ